MAGEEFTEVFEKLLQTSLTPHRTSYDDSDEQSFLHAREDVTLHVGQARDSRKIGLHFISVWTHENTRMLLSLRSGLRRARSSDIYSLAFSSGDVVDVSFAGLQQ